MAISSDVDKRTAKVDKRNVAVFNYDGDGEYIAIMEVIVSLKIYPCSHIKRIGIRISADFTD